ncbi:MAG: FAD binding domain-containing protein [Anaerolineae bacterium]|nr:FAD binding domain-containing protein [Anaerolineae bacterium]
MTMNRFAYAKATSIDEAVSVLDGTCRPLAGGTDLVAMMKDDLTSPDRLVSIKTIPGLDHVGLRADGWHIGALTTLAALASATELAEVPGMACLVAAAAHSASPQLRHMATLGGNLLQRPRCWYFRNPKVPCWRKGGDRCYAIVGQNQYHTILGRSPCVAVHPSDPSVALLALDASVQIAGPRDRRLVRLAKFYQPPSREVQMADGYRPVTVLAPDELITEIIVPVPPEGSRSIYVKKMERGAWDFALVSVAASLVMAKDSTVETARVALGGVANVPWRAADAEAVLTGKALDGDRIAAAADAAVADARALEHNGYKIDLVKAAVREALQALGGA